MALAGLGIFCSLVGIFAVRAKEDASFGELTQRSSHGRLRCICTHCSVVWWIVLLHVQGLELK